MELKVITRASGVWLTLIGLALSVPASSFAHHGQSVVRPQGVTPLPPDELTARQLTLSYAWWSGADTYRGEAPHPNLSLGELSQQTLTLSGSALLMGSLSGELSASFGRVSWRSADGGSQAYTGLGDTSLSLSYMASVRDTLKLQSSVGLSAPTGAYHPSNALELTELSAQRNGEISISQYAAQVSLGSGVWSGTLAFLSTLTLSTRYELKLGGLLSQPLTETSDGVLWGRDLGAHMTGAIDLTDRSKIGLTGRYQHHAQDRSPLSSDDLSSLPSTRDMLSLEAHAHLQVLTQLSCQASISAPLWRRVDGVQIVETLRSSLSCAHSW